jgi:hypothetical protein
MVVTHQGEHCVKDAPKRTNHHHSIVDLPSNVNTSFLNALSHVYHSYYCGSMIFRCWLCEDRYLDLLELVVEVR